MLDYWRYCRANFICGIAVYIGFDILNGNIPPLIAGGSSFESDFRRIVCGEQIGAFPD